MIKLGFRPARWACAVALLSAASQAQTLPNLPATLNSGTYSGAPAMSNCQTVAPPSGCGAATLANDANVVISAGSQVVLGPGFTANAANTSTSLLITLAAPANSSVTPASGSGATQNFTFTASSAAGGANLASLEVIFNWATWGADACWVQYYRTSNLLYLYSDDATQLLGGLTPGAAGTVSNSQCSLNSANSTASISGNNLSVTLGLTFKPAFIGPQEAIMAAYDNAGLSSVWQQMGTWTGYAAPYSQPPTVSVTPTSGAGMGVDFTFTATDLNGAAYMPWEWIFLGSYGNPGRTLIVYHSDNAAYLENDNDSAWIYVAPGGSASNSQCTINGTSGSDSGNNWTYNVSVAFTAAYAGVSKPIYLQAFDHADQTSGAQQVGTWTVVAPDFSIGLTPTANPATAMVGGRAAFTVAVSPIGGFNSTVTLTALGLPTGASASFSPATITGSGTSTMTVTAPGSAGNIAVVATGTSGSLTHNASAVLAVQDFTFVLSPAYPSPVTVLPNGQTVVTAFTGGLNGFGQQGQTISLAYRQVSIGGLTPCALPQADWSNDYSSSTSVAPGQQATLLLQAGNANQYYCTFQVTASYGSTQHSQYGYLIQQGTGGFLLSAPAQQTVAAGQTATFPAAYTPYAGFNGNVTYSLSGQVPSGATASFTALSSPQLGSALNVYVPPGTLATTYGMMITASSPSGCTPGSSGCASQSVGAQLVVQSGLGFSITATPVTSTTVAPGGTAQYNITVNSSGGYTGVVNLSTSGGPSAASVTLSAYSVQAGGAPVTLTIATTANTPLSTYATVVTATSGSVSQYGAAPLIVTLPAAASMLTPPPGANIAGGNTTFTWNAGLGATQYTVTAVTTNGQTSATTGPGQLSATLSLPATTQTATVTLQTTTASGALMQYYSYTIQPSGTAQWLTLAAGNTMPTLVANGQEALYTFVYNSSGGARPSPQDIGDCISDEVAIRIRIANLTAGTATLGFTAPIGTPTAQFEWECNDGDGSGSGGGGPGTTGDPTPEIDSVSPVPLAAGTTTAIRIQGEYFGLSGSLDFEEGCSQSGDIISWSDGSIAVYVSVGAGASTYCTVAVNVAYDDSGNSFVPGDGSSPESEPFDIIIENSAPAGQPSVTITSRPITISPSPTTPGQYVATLTSVASPPGGVYTWSTNNPNMVGFVTAASGPSASQVTLGILSTGATASITLTYVGPSGAVATDSFTFALTNDTSVVAWVNATLVPVNLTIFPAMGAFDPVVQALTGTIGSCLAEAGAWQMDGMSGGGGIGNNGLTANEVTFANEFLINGSGNVAPPQQLTNPTAFAQAGNFRLFQRLQLSYEVLGGAIIPSTQTVVQQYRPTDGMTPEPCSHFQLVSLPSQANSNDTVFRLSSDDSIFYQINEARLGPEGQAVNQFLNGVPGQNYTLATPWIWSAIQFDANGITRPWTQGANSNNLQIFPAYQVYSNGIAVQPPIAQGNVFTFIGLNSSSQFTGNQ